jgi:hypothetical protein
MNSSKGFSSFTVVVSCFEVLVVVVTAFVVVTGAVLPVVVTSVSSSETLLHEAKDIINRMTRINETVFFINYTSL